MNRVETQAVRVISRMQRSFWSWQLGRVSRQTLEMLGARSLLEAFKRTARSVSAYRELFAETGHTLSEVTDVASFQRLAPLLSKDCTFQRFSLEALTVPGSLSQLASVLTSSGHSGRFAFGLSTHAMHARAQSNIELALQLNFGVDDHPTLLINCLPMGVHFAASNCTVADVSVREDMALALLTKFRSSYEQFILVVDPLFLKRLLDEARAGGFSFDGMRIHLIIGEETFGENFRSYVASALHADPEKKEHALLGSSMGVGELGLNLFFETRAAIRLRRTAFRNSELRAEMLGRSAAPEAVPLVFCHSPLQYFVESVSVDPRTRYGRLAVSTLSKTAPLPLLRYLTGDVVRLLTPSELDDWAKRFQSPGSNEFQLPVALVRGREGDAADALTHVTEVKDTLYREPEIAHELSGAFRMVTGVTALEVQLRKGSSADPAALSKRLEGLFSQMLPGYTVRAWRYEQFAYGMELDYERKFNYLTAS